MLSLAVFFALNPVWWDDPVTRVGDTIEARVDVLDTQVNVFGGYDNLGDQLNGFWRQVFVVEPQYYESPAWGDFTIINRQIDNYEDSFWRGFSFGQHQIVAIITGLLTLIGLYRLITKRDLQRSVRLLTVLWILTIFITTALLTPLEWQRYYLLTYAPLGLLVALGISWLGTLMVNVTKNRNHT